MMKALCFAAAIMALTFGSASAAQTKKNRPSSDSPQVLTAEPGKGRLPLGEVVYVDDHSCPSGQIKKVTGGSSIVPRERECVARP